MFSIQIKDTATDKITAAFLAEKFIAVGQVKNEFTKSFSSNDVVEQLGLLEFALQQVRQEVPKPGGLGVK